MKETAMNQCANSLLGQLRSLEVGETLTVPVSRASYFRSICVSFGLQWGKKFTVRTDRRQSSITATRIS